MRGCHLCATQTVMQFKGSDGDLYNCTRDTGRARIDSYLAGQPVYEDDMPEVVEESDRV